MDAVAAKRQMSPVPFRDMPALIERVWPAQKISVEAQKERKANLGQTLTGLGSYWKGRKPLVLVRACVLAALLPSTGDDVADLETFEILMGMSDGQVAHRFKSSLSIEEIEKYGTAEEVAALIESKLVKGKTEKRLAPISMSDRQALMTGILKRMPYADRVAKLLRPEEIAEDELTKPYLQAINARLGTNAVSLAGLLNELGEKRFGERPRVADTFAGGGSIPFEAARLGVDVYASDLNPIACMLTWGALNVVGATAERRAEIAKAEQRLAVKVNKELARLGIEFSASSDRAKAYLYCLEARCPQTKWMIPLSTTWAISKSRNVIGRLVPDRANKRFNIEVVSGVSDEELAQADLGTIRGGNMVYELDGETYSTPIKTIRGDRRTSDGGKTSDLRLWTKDDFKPAPKDIFQERLYCIQWITRESLEKTRQETFFAAPTEHDLAVEKKIEKIVTKNLSAWQDEGVVPDMKIEAGDETSRLIRERGWTYWHHLFTPRDYIVLSIILKNIDDPSLLVAVPSVLNHASKMCQWITSAARKDANGKQLGGPRELPNHVFYNQALNTFWNYASRASIFLLKDLFLTSEVQSFPLAGERTVASHTVGDLKAFNHVYITDPPYADAVNYHEITEYFISWVRGVGRKTFPDWTWDSRRPVAIKGDGEEFRHNMVAEDDVFVMNWQSEDSLDGRYFGPLPASAVIGRVVPVWAHEE